MYLKKIYLSKVLIFNRKFPVLVFIKLRKVTYNFEKIQ